MQRFGLFGFMLALLLATVACAPVQDVARDGIAASKGALVTAQSKYRDQCTANPAMKPCRIIHEGVAAQHLAVEALDLYCQGVATPSFLDGGKCSPDKSVEPRLKAALQNLDVMIRDVKGLIQ